MNETITITKAKERLSELVGRLIHRKDRIFITRKGKAVAVLMPFGAYKDLVNKDSRGLLAARGVLAGHDDEIERLCGRVYDERKRERDREVPL